MTYRYVLKMDQRSLRYDDKWVYRNMDTIVTVDAENFEDAKTEAIRLMPPLWTKYQWWTNVQSITKLDEPVEVNAQPAPTILHRSPRGFRYRGA